MWPQHRLVVGEMNSQDIRELVQCPKVLEYTADRDYLARRRLRRTILTVDVVSFPIALLLFQLAKEVV